MKIVLVTGSYPPDACGVGDYTSHLAEALLKQGIKIEIVSKENWLFKNALHIAKRITALNPDIIHIQYPTVGYGYGLAPQIISLLSQCVVTLHEISQAHLLRQLALYPFSIRSLQIVFSNCYERDYAAKWAPWIINRSAIINIGSSIPFIEKNYIRNNSEVLYFGFIRPHKGLEEFLDLARLSKNNNKPFMFTVIGSVLPNCHEYMKNIRRQYHDLQIDWRLNLSPEDVADNMNKATYAYLHYPDGVSIRRSSLLAALGNGLITIGNRGVQTSDEVSSAVCFAESPKEALSILDNLVKNINLLEAMRQRTKRFMGQFTWEHIARQHINLYEKILSARRKSI